MVFGYRKIKNFRMSLEISFLFVAIILFSKANLFFGLIVFIVALLACYPYLDYLFSSTKVIFNPQQFVVKKKRFFEQSQQQGKTEYIQSVMEKARSELELS